MILVILVRIEIQYVTTILIFILFKIHLIFFFLQFYIVFIGNIRICTFYKNTFQNLSSFYSLDNWADNFVSSC